MTDPKQPTSAACRHFDIVRWYEVGGDEVALWSCANCRIRFYPHGPLCRRGCPDHAADPLTQPPEGSADAAPALRAVAEAARAYLALRTYPDRPYVPEEPLLVALAALDRHEAGK